MIFNIPDFRCLLHCNAMIKNFICVQFIVKLEIHIEYARYICSYGHLLEKEKMGRLEDNFHYNSFTSKLHSSFSKIIQWDLGSGTLT